MSLRDKLLLRLNQSFAGKFSLGPPDERLVATFPASHPLVGDATVWDDQDEAMIAIGTITHLHIDASDWKQSGSETPVDVALLDLHEQVAAAVVDWLSDLFDDRILLWCSPTAPGLGGSRNLPLTKDWSLMKPEHKTFLWSGPVANTFSDKRV